MLFVCRVHFNPNPCVYHSSTQHKMCFAQPILACYRPQSSSLLKASTSKQHKHEGGSAAAAYSQQPQTQSKRPPITAKGTANGGEPQPDGDTAAKGCQLEPGLVRRLFDKELDNQHEEALLLAQLVAHQLRLALHSNTDNHLVQRVIVWAIAAEQVSTQVEPPWPLKLPTMRSSPLTAPAAKSSRPLGSGSIMFDLQSGTCNQSIP